MNIIKSNNVSISKQIVHLIKNGQTIAEIDELNHLWDLLGLSLSEDATWLPSAIGPFYSCDGYIAIDVLDKEWMEITRARFAAVGFTYDDEYQDWLRKLEQYFNINYNTTTDHYRARFKQ